MIERTARVTDLHDDSAAARDLAYWLSRPSAERIAEVERLRREFFGIQVDGDFPRLQRVARVLERHED
ncbi:MAG: hypothetical protein ACKOYN_00980 [Planctomycetota bacterium]